MNVNETTHLMDSAEYKYFKIGHICRLKNQKNMQYATFEDTVKCDCKVYFERLEIKK